MESEKERLLLANLGRRRVFTTEELASEISGDTRRAAAVARRLKSSGFLQRVQKGVYAAVPLEVNPKHFRPDPYLTVHSVLGPSHAFSHFSALTLLGLSHQDHQTVHVTKPGAKARRLRVGDQPVHVHNAEPDRWAFATVQEKRGGQRLLVTTPARTLMDLLSLPAHKQDYEEMVQAFRAVLNRSNHADLVAEGRLWGTKTAQARLGHLISRYGDSVHSDGQPFDGMMGDFITLKSPTYFGTQPRNPANRLDSAFNVVYPSVM